MDDTKVDILCVGAHSDDIDATIGGFVAKLAKQGYIVEIVDLTVRKGMYFSDEEASGDEANKAAQILGVRRSVVDLGLLKIENNYGNRLKVAEVIRSRRPDILITVGKDETHPDHNATHQLVLDAQHYAFASAIKLDEKPWRVKGIYFTPTNALYEKLPPEALFVDVSETFETKIEALKAYASQMLFHAHNQKYGLEFIKSSNRAWGLLIGSDYAEVVVPRLPVMETFRELRKL